MVGFLRRTTLVGGAALSILAGAVATVPVALAAAPQAPDAAGTFTADVDFSTLTASDVRGNKCEFTVNGTLTFTGTLVGAADGTTTAVIFAPCADATTNPPGTFFDVFRFEGTFTGSVDGSPVTGPLSYAGVTRVGGVIDALILLHGDQGRAALRADAEVAVGGSYTGVAQAR